MSRVTWEWTDLRWGETVAQGVGGRWLRSTLISEQEVFVEYLDQHVRHSEHRCNAGSTPLNSTQLWNNVGVVSLSCPCSCWRLYRQSRLVALDPLHFDPAWCRPKWLPLICWSVHFLKGESAALSVFWSARVFEYLNMLKPTMLVISRKSEISEKKSLFVQLWCASPSMLKSKGWSEYSWRQYFCFLKDLNILRLIWEKGRIYPILRWKIPYYDPLISKWWIVTWIAWTEQWGFHEAPIKGWSSWFAHPTVYWRPPSQNCLKLIRSEMSISALPPSDPWLSLMSLGVIKRELTLWWLSSLFGIFIHLKMWIADAIHIFKLIKIISIC